MDDGLPEIFLGLNQTIMFGLFMVMIAGSIGSIDLSPEIFRTLIFNDGGKGFVIGLCVAFIGLTTDRLLVEWAGRRKRMYGLVAQSKFGSAKSCKKLDHRIWLRNSRVLGSRASVKKVDGGPCSTITPRSVK